MHQTLVPSAVPHRSGLVCNAQQPGGGHREIRKFKVLLGGVVNSRPVGDTGDPDSKLNK